MLAELPERDAHGVQLDIYEQIKVLSGIPYVSSMQRHLATRPGWLEWTWELVSPLFVNGVAQEAAWRATTATLIAHPSTPLPALSPQALMDFGLEANEHALAVNIVEGFVRVSPTNLAFSGVVRHVLEAYRDEVDISRERYDDSAPVRKWAAPAMLAPMPVLVPFEQLSANTLGSLKRFETQVAGAPFVPGLYRMLARWPAFLDYLAEHLAPRFDDPLIRANCGGLADAIDAAVARLPLPKNIAPPPSREELPDILDAIAMYRVTSPQMVVFGDLIRRALLAPENGRAQSCM
ncbi:MAG: hypothetical protein ACI8PT_002237 [Gammaproteobacteria bacterium]|jgi:hypothetical protein